MGGTGKFPSQTSVPSAGPPPPSAGSGQGGWNTFAGGGQAGYPPGPMYGNQTPALYASEASRYSSTTPALSTPAGFIPPPGGYGVPTNVLQQVNTPYPPSSLSGSPVATATPSQQAGFTPISTQPNYNMMMGGTTGYKSTMK